MEGLTTCSISRRFVLPFTIKKRQRLHISTGASFLVMASSSSSSDGEPKLDQWDKMELKFGRLLGEDPKLTLAKIMGRKSNPDISYLEIEKSFGKNKGKLNEDIVYVPFDVDDREPPSHLTRKNTQRTEKLNLVRPIVKGQSKASEMTVEKPIATETKANHSQSKISTKDVSSNVMLRKPSIIQSDDIDMLKPSKVKIKPNLSLKMRKEPKLSVQNVSDMILLKKPEPTNSLDLNQQNRISDDSSVGSDSVDLRTSSANMIEGVKLAPDHQQDRLDRSETEGMMDSAKPDFHGLKENNGGLSSELLEVDDEAEIGLQPNVWSDDRSSDKEDVPTQSLCSSDHGSVQASLQGKPQRFDPPIKERPGLGGEEGDVLNDGNDNDTAVFEYRVPAVLEEHEDGDWGRAEALLQSGERVEVELISCSSRGFVVSFGSLIGFLPYRNLGSRWKFLAFESWLRKKGLDPSLYRKNLSILGSYGAQNKNLAPDLNLNPETGTSIEAKLPPNTELENLLEKYDQEKAKFLSSFIGQRTKVNIVLADRKSRRLLFSGRPKEKEELIEKKRSLMAKLSIGDVVKCYIKKITYFGIFVEVEGVPALIHQSEVSWDATLDPSYFFKVGQMVEAKVHQLDFSLERITLSLKEVTPDPLMETLEAVIADCDTLNGTPETGQVDAEWSDMEALVKELQQIKGIQSVSKGRFFLSPGLAPTFQVYMASVFDNQYKLLARSGNKVQEVIVQASLDKDQMKSAILICTGRVV